jgi:hypothetical protein
VKPCSLEIGVLSLEDMPTLKCISQVKTDFLDQMIQTQDEALRMPVILDALRPLTSDAQIQTDDILNIYRTLSSVNTERADFGNTFGRRLSADNHLRLREIKMTSSAFREKRDRKKRTPNTTDIYRPLDKFRHSEVYRSQKYFQAS